MKRTSTSSRTRIVKVGALAASAAMVVVGLQSGSATAAPDLEAGASAVVQSGPQRAAAIAQAQAGAAATAKAIGLGSAEALVVRDVIRDADGTVHTRYERTYAGLPVLGGDLVVHQKSGALLGTTRANDAKISLASTDAPASIAAPKGARKVVWAAEGPAVLAWETVVKGTDADGTPSKVHTITDARTGKKLYSFNSVFTSTGTGSSQYSGKVKLSTTLSSGRYSLKDLVRGGHKTYDLKGGSEGRGSLFTDSNNIWGNGSITSRQTAGVDAAYGAAVTWDFYKNQLKRLGIRGDGVGAYSRVHYGNGYVNAFWDDDCFCMTYGDGEGNADPLTSLDVAGHEMSHGLTASTAGLIYSKESGGLNEATSDIFGTSVEFYANNPSDRGDYLIGEKIDIFGNGSPLRFMDKPSKDGKSADNWYSGLGNLNVHYSSGPANHFFYLLSEGSGSKTINGVKYNSPAYGGITVKGIGRTKAYKIWYKALSTYMTSTTNYKKARTATLSAAKDLYGSTSTEYKAVNTAWKGINVK
ncbi:M4 family metallopeptidase [Streptomyces sp. NPDC089919]|uniref:M4 family metallopeptidase n=1 Tax=Streptomyces sp. NPDC089919 TaxID=3155188 RepID=UPI0034420211